MAHSPHRPRIVIAVRRAERHQQKNAIQISTNDARNRLSTCGPKKYRCVLVEEAEGTFGDRKIGETYVIAPT
jgi:hypothetical protein